MTYGPTTETYAGDDKRWLASAHGTDTAESVPVTVTSGDVTTHGKTLPSGVPMNRDGTVDADGDDTDVHGLLLNQLDISAGPGTYTGAMLWHGKVSDAGRVAKGLTALTGDQKDSIAANTQITVV